MQPIDRIYRNYYSKLVSALIKYFGLSNFAIAEDIVHDTFVTAIEDWKVNGEPQEPEKWLYKVCRNKTLNYLNKRSSVVMDDSRMAEAASTSKELENLFLEDEIKDSQLRLLFACCDDRLSPKAQVILILKNLCGLKVPEIANAVLMQEEAVTKSLTRSKNTISKGSSLSVPVLNASQQRLNVVHTAIYLLFMEGYAATEGDSIIRKELCIESMRLIKVILEIHQLRNHDSFALMALMCFHSARFEARVGAEGELLELEKQDRAKWDKDLIALGIHYLKSAHDSQVTSRFIYEAAIASVHSVAERFEDTNWPVISGLYDRLLELQSSPFIELNRAVAIFYVSGADEALRVISKSQHLAWLKNFYLYHALLGKIFSAKGDGLQAIQHYEKALSLAKLKAEQEFLRRKITSLQVMMN